MEPRPYQQKLIDDIKRAFLRGNRSVCAVLSCGGGKSVIAAMIAKSATDKGNRVLFIVHRQELCKQIHDTFAECGVNMSLCTVGMVQTVTRRLDRTEAPALIIVDEAHHALANTYRRIFDRFEEALILGFTATPVRLDDGGLGAVFGALVESVSTKWLIENNHLSPYRLYSFPVADTSALRVKRGEYDNAQLSAIMENNHVYGQTVETYRRIAGGRKALAYCISVESAQQTAEEFRANGYNAASLDGSTSKDERGRIMQAFRDGEITILCNCELFGEGLDVPDCEVSILLRKTKSLTLYIQQAMRCMRYQPDKTAIIIDHVANCFEHGLPDDDREWTLETKKRKSKQEAPVKQCPTCFAVVRSGIYECPECGYQFPKQERATGEVVDTQLIEITADMLRRKPYSHYRQLRTWEELEAFRMAKGYKLFWSIYKALELNIEVPRKYDHHVRLAIENQRKNICESNNAAAAM